MFAAGGTDACCGTWWASGDRVYLDDRSSRPVNRSLGQIVASLMLLVQCAVTLLGGPGAVSCLACFAGRVEVAAADDEGDESACCCGTSCGCCGEKKDEGDRRSPAKDDERCPYRIEVPTVTTHTLRVAAADDVRDVHLPVAALLTVDVLSVRCGARIYELPPPDPGPMRIANGVSITVQVI